MVMSNRLDRRRLLAAGAVATGSTLAAAASAGTGSSPPSKAMADALATGHAIPAAAFGLDPASPRDQSERLQTAIDQASAKGLALALPPGRIVAGNIILRPGSRLVGAPGHSTLAYAGTGTFLTAQGARSIRIEAVTLDGAMLALDRKRVSGLIELSHCSDVVINDSSVRGAAANAIVLRSASGRIMHTTIAEAQNAAIFSIDGDGIEIAGNTILDCAENGILVWRTRHGSDATQVTGNRILRIANRSGGTGQYGNGINIYRAAGVLVSANRIADCAYSGVRANESSNVQILANSIERMGEVALYAEAAAEQASAPGFEGAMIANNLVDTAATGIAVTNFNNGGRLAVVSGNIVRNLFRREQEARDKRGEGIGVEADAVVANNVIENAPAAGLMIGWGRHMREVVATGNLIRRARIGIAVTGDPGAGQCLIAQNMISGASDGAIRAMDHARAVGADLASGRAPGKLTIAGNVVS